MYVEKNVDEWKLVERSGEEEFIERAIKYWIYYDGTKLP